MDEGEIATIVGKNVAALRRRAGLSLRELAGRADVSPSTLSSIEAGHANPALETLVTVSRALGVPFSRLVLAAQDEVEVQRAIEGVTMESAEASLRSRLVCAVTDSPMTELYEARLAGGAVYRAEPHLAGVRESVIVVKGRIRVGPEGAAVELKTGDRATFTADQPHTYEALTANADAILVLAYR